ncbi:MAG: TIGR03013 family PEP-CTERM/XrtA system glycosyltransferase [Deltaproteobacteria bacterium]|nr:TIGR03013 family PEP-CTERM/XrtA system glycosyltransferase [Candidatus Anaeroferrophillus wilburensis]MBN2888470.1 TIGR03013 family PEP-CTERM/XrtA system glycosyltransferase [Deltaproteobacteria bacterium]
MSQFGLRNVVFFLIESALIIGGGLLVTASYVHWFPESGYSLQLFVAHIFLFAVCYHFSLFYFDLYDIRTRIAFVEYGLRLIQATGLLCLFMAFFSYVSPANIFPSPLIYAVLLAAFLLVFAWRIFFDWLSRHERFTEPIIIVGNSPMAGEICASIARRQNTGFHVVGVIGEQPSRNSERHVPEHLLVGSDVDICHLAAANRVNRIVVSLRQRRGVFPADELLQCKMTGMTIVEDIDFYEQLEGKILIDNLRTSWLIFTQGFKKPQRTRMLKRVIGMILATIGLLISAPVLVLVACAVKLDSRGPVFFIQERLGENEKPFSLIKFRSMRTDAEKDGPVWAREDDDRVTRVGRFLRKTRLDELPQLINIFKGDMSFVGPRPERKFFIDQLKDEIPYYTQRFTVKPGVTGWAQIRYPYGASVEDAREKLQYELYYIKHLSSMLDLLIVLETIKVVLFGRGGR